MIQRRNEEEYKTWSFPAKLSALLEDAERLGFDGIVSWQPQGTSFKVMQPARFAKDIMQSYFNQTKYKSFQRQLNIYGFHRIHLGPNMGGYLHRKFNRQSPELFDSIVRRPTNQIADPAAKRKVALTSYPAKQHVEESEYTYPSHHHEIKLEDSEVTAFYDFFYPQDRTEQAWISSIFENDASIEQEIDFLNDITAISGGFDINCQEEAEQQSFSLSMSDGYNQTHQPATAAAVSDHEVEEEEQVDSDELQQAKYSFPWKLHQMLERAQIENLQHIVSWEKDGSAFQVHDNRLFVEKVMPNYFDQTKYESFRRQLNLYGFTRVSKGPGRGVISHPEFVEGARSRCRSIVRKVS